MTKRFIAMGAEKSVYEDPKQHPEEPNKKVIAELRDEDETINSVKARYYLAKIANILYPGFYPEVDLAGSNYNGEGKFFIRAKKLKRDLPHRIINQRDYYLHKNLPVPRTVQFLFRIMYELRKRNKRLDKKMKKAEALGLPIDGYVGNFSRQPDGEFRNLDTPSPWVVLADENKQKYIELEVEEAKLLKSIEALPQASKIQCLKYWQMFKIHLANFLKQFEEQNKK
jgi:hypothetical protein